MASTMLMPVSRPGLTLQKQFAAGNSLSVLAYPSAGRSARVITSAGPLDRFTNATKKAAGGKLKTDPSAKNIDTPESGFTRKREIVVGRLAMTGFFAEVVGEILTGKGAVGQLSLETVLPRPLIGGVIAAIVLFNFVTALNPAGPTFDEENQADVGKRPKGAVQKPGKNLVSNPKETLGISDSFGFTKRNELFVGRLAMIGFAASLVGEYFQNGKGPLGQLGIPMPAYADYAAFGLAGWILFFFAAAVGSGNFPGETDTSEEIY